MQEDPTAESETKNDEIRRIKKESDSHRVEMGKMQPRIDLLQILIISQNSKK